MKPANWRSFMASDMPPLPKELFTWLRNLFLHEVDSIALTACEISFVIINSSITLHYY